jgi:hypothetical protein
MMDDSLTSEFKRLLVYLFKTDSSILKHVLYTIELIGDLILDLALEEVDKGEDCHTYRRWVYTRCFKESESCGSLKLRSSDECSSICAVASYFLKMGGMIQASRPVGDPDST